MKKFLAVILAVMVLGMLSTVDMSAKKRTSTKTRTTLVSKGRCTKCGGSGKVKCGRCGGKGYTVKKGYGDDGYYTDFHGCSKCGGYGIKYDVGYEAPYRKGSGRISCPRCHGRR